MSQLKIKRKCEMWVSNNRFLTGSSKKDPGRNPNFEVEETKVLISLWGDPKIQRALITSHRKSTVMSKLVEKMREHGYRRSGAEINTRIKNLKCLYNRIKKDIDLGISNGSKWKHFKVIDEIMTNSVFSVHPNEIPKPSLKYQLEIGKADEKGGNEIRTETIGNVSSKSLLNSRHAAMGSVDSFDNEFPCPVSKRTDAHMRCDKGGEMKAIEVLEAHGDGNGDCSFILPKTEPVDVDMEFQSGAKLITNRTSKTPANTNTMGVSSTLRELSAGKVSNSLQTAPSSTKLVANEPSTIPSAGNISLVPTNFLLRQKTAEPQQIQIRQQLQPRIICGQSNVQTNTSMVPQTGTGRMKVLLVNAFQNRQQKKNFPIPTDEASRSIIMTANLHKINAPNSMDSIKLAETYSKTKNASKDKDLGEEKLLKQLIAMQTENNEIQNQRLGVEKQRIEFEKTTGKELLRAFVSLIQVQNPDLAQNTNINETE